MVRGCSVAKPEVIHHAAGSSTAVAISVGLESGRLGAIGNLMRVRWSVREGAGGIQEDLLTGGNGDIL